MLKQCDKYRTYKVKLHAEDSNPYRRSEIDVGVQKSLPFEINMLQSVLIDYCSLHCYRIIESIGCVIISHAFM